LQVTWLVAFYAAWSPACINFAHIFSKLSHNYSLPNLRFGKVDVGRFADIAAEYHINTSALSRQLPTVIMFQVGQPQYENVKSFELLDPDPGGQKLTPKKEEK
jgi:thioredoxin-like negative regulator of GroEL